MDYEKKYKEIVGKIRKAYLYAITDSTKAVLEEIFPELKESEDERIRKELLESFKYQQRESRTDKEWLNGIKLSEVVAWLEKQGKQTSWKPSKEEMDVLYGLAYITNQYDEHKEEVITRLYQDLKREFFNGSSYENMFPNTEDAVRRRSTIQVLEYARSLDTYNQYGKVDIDKNIAWLEKQGERKPVISDDALREGIAHFGITQYQIDNWLKKYIDVAKQGEQPQGKSEVEAAKEEKIDNANKVESKFKAGDWIIRCAEGFKHNTYRVIEVQDYYVCEALNGRQVTFTFNDVHQNFKLWNISDAKDGDVLAEDTCIFIIKKLYNDITAKIYCCLFDDGDFDLTGSTLGFDEDSTFPATKEQRDFLLKEMYMRGYIFDFEKKELKELKEIEKNLDDKDEPKFKAGDWIVHNGDSCICQIKSIREDEYCVWPLDSEVEGYLKITDIDNKYHLWTIKDAKNGDVLVTANTPFLYSNYKKDKYGIICLSYGGISSNTNEFIVNTNPKKHWCDVKFVKPATREKRNLLFQKMKEAGYEWDAKKKELTKIEKKPYWSEEDERIIKRIDSLLYSQCKIHGSEYEEIHNWLKPLKERVQPKQEWSEEDEKMFKSVIINMQNLQFSEEMREKYCYIRSSSTNTNYYQTLIEWLKSLKDRYICKESNESMIALRQSISGCSYDSEPFIET